jgi:hypothetical protein
MSSPGAADSTTGSHTPTSNFPITLSQATEDYIQTMQGFQEGGFLTNFNDFMTVGIQRGTPESIRGTATSARREPYTALPLSIHNPVNKLNLLMLPSEDPFAYPSQPMMRLGFQAGQPDSICNQGQDIQPFLTGTFDDVESHIFGPPQPYMMHQ